MSGLRRALIGIGIAGFAAGVGIALLAANSDHLELRGVAVALGLLLGWSFIGTGLYAWDRRPENGTGALMVAVGFAWFVSTLVTANSELVFTVGLLVNNLFFATLLHLLLAFPVGPARDAQPQAPGRCFVFRRRRPGRPGHALRRHDGRRGVRLSGEPADGAGQPHDRADPRRGADHPGDRAVRRGRPCRASPLARRRGARARRAGADDLGRDRDARRRLRADRGRGREPGRDGADPLLRLRSLRWRPCPTASSSACCAAGRRGSRSRTCASTPPCAPASRSCAPRARASSRPATRRAAGSSATCTTARSSGSSRWRST